MGRRRAARAALVAVWSLAVAVFGCSAAVAGSIKDYAGDMVSLDAAGKVESTSRLFFSGGNVRVEIPAQEDMGPMVIIVRPDRKVQWMIDVKAKTYFEQQLDEKTIADMSRGGGAAMPMGEHVVKEEPLGSEKVNGYDTRKKRVTSTSKVMGKTYTSVSTVWMADEFDVPLRERDEQGGAEEFRNIVVGAQPAALFEVPKGYARGKGMPGMPDMDMPDMPDMKNMPDMKALEGMGMPPGMKMPGQ
ncbi:DUF4412 domain-containing protein [Nitratidesulfovibrio sp. HK-II]|uniref:DUF4412 domain-containing protein n=1 Tax=Nitratidesulfovibrio sp. HK-II TaxID=2009266 RepID=UPI000E2E6BE9|nr:DUF4412 domain-containing protein [Nitratidesulfovibrio sp. HK-II]GBO95114.1 hypothetical protein RVX_0157 [Nitratidesulfovibrio sp. HK-II]